MSVWLTYSLSDFLLFSPRTYYRQFELLNLALWPAHILTGALGLAIPVLAHYGGAWRGRAVSLILSACWLWVAWAYLLTLYDPINWAARYYAAGFAAQALLLLVTGVIMDRLALRPGADRGTLAGLAIFLFTLAVQPLIGPLVGRGWLQVELFGIAPDPTVAATIGVLLMTERPRWHLLVVPVLWCAVTGLTLWAMGTADALLMPALGALAVIFAASKALYPAGSGAGTRSPQ